jgi:hypothetical protein
MTDAWYSRCHTIQMTDHVIMYNVVDAIVLVAQPLQYQFDTAAVGLLTVLLLVKSCTYGAAAATLVSIQPPSIYRTGSLSVLQIILKQISEVEEKPFTSSLNIFLEALDRDGRSVASPQHCPVS